MAVVRAESFFVCVRSFWFVGDADVVRVVLAEQGVPCHIENERFLVWHWLYANLSGGFKVLVPRERAEEAARVLDSPVGDCFSHAERQSWTCPQCGRAIDGDWDVCWFCSALRSGAWGTEVGNQMVVETNSGNVEEETDSSQAYAPAMCLILAVLFWATGGSLAVLLLGTTLAIVARNTNGKRRPPSAERPSEDDLEAERRAMASPPTAAEQSHQRRMEMGSRVAQRALFMAVFAAGWFPPLLICAVNLLWRLDPRRTPLGPRERGYVVLAWGLCGIALLFLVPAALVAFSAVGESVGLMGNWSP